jgi:methylmalonyl-CoA/ethylmalonyl-CoA epimerase
MKIHHIGYLAKKMDKSLAEFSRLGYRTEKEPAYDDVRDVNIAFVVNGEYSVELIEPASADSPMAPLLSRFKNTPYHICYEVEDLDAAADELTAGGYTTLQPPAPAPCIDGRRVVFLLHKAMGIIELLEA